MRFRKPEPVPLLFIVVAVLILGGLGVWQVQRLAWKNALTASIEKSQQEKTLNELPRDLSNLEYRNVSLYGTYLNDKALHEVSAPQNGVQGFFVVTPLKLRDGNYILVNRGFAPAGKELKLSGAQKVKGILRPLHSKRYFSPENNTEKNVWFYEDIPAIEKFTGVKLLPIVIEATGKREAGLYPIPSEGKFVLRNDHLTYAITWFSLAIIGLVMFLFYHRIPGKVRYVSTRGTAPTLPFDEAVLAGLARDGGLYVPDHIPALSKAEIAALKGLPYREVAFRIISRFVDDSIEPQALKRIIDQSYDSFRDSDIAPVAQLNDTTFVLELFHGPTLAFKDFALQFLGNLLNYILEKRGQKVTVIGATSGDTGSAAIAGCSGRRNMRIFILHPENRVSEVQRRQMTTVDDNNVYNVAIKGTFDDCQNIVKALFNDAPFRDQQHLTAVNSINWARIMAQVPYYFYAALKLGAPEQAVSFSVPTGNFGDIFAGYIAKQMGLPIDQLIIATNKNDILARCVATGRYGMEGVAPSLSPSMDIQVSSNFERLLFDVYKRNPHAIIQLMNDLREGNGFSLSPAAHEKIKSLFASASVDDAETLATIAEVYEKTSMLLDPHTAVGVSAGLKCHNGASPLVVLATAHPAKFPDAVKQATGVYPELPEHLADLFERRERFDVLANDAASVKNYIEKKN